MHEGHPGIPLEPANNDRKVTLASILSLIVFEVCQLQNKHQRQLRQPDVFCFFTCEPVHAQEEWSNVWTKRRSPWPIHSLAFVQTLPAVHHLGWSAAEFSIMGTSIN